MPAFAFFGGAAVYIAKPIKQLMGRLEAAGHSAFLVGGWVRDALLGRRPGDLDIATDALPHEVCRIFNDFRLDKKGLEFGVVLILTPEGAVEVATLRRDGPSGDARRPAYVCFTKSLEEDSRRRDFTINAMAADLEGRIYDFHGGRDDLNNKLVRCVGDADKSFGEDALRILRALRFACTLGFEVEQGTADAIKRQAGLVRQLSPARIFEETDLILRSAGCAGVLTEFWQAAGNALPIPLFARQPCPDTRDILLAGDRLCGEARLCAFLSFGFGGGAWARDVLKGMGAPRDFRERIVLIVSAYHAFFGGGEGLGPNTRLIKDDIARVLEIYEAVWEQKPPRGKQKNAKNEQTAKRLKKTELYPSLKDLDISAADIAPPGALAGADVGRIMKQLLFCVREQGLENRREKLRVRAKELI